MDRDNEIRSSSILGSRPAALTEWAYTIIKELILTRQIEPGAPIPLDRLSLQMGVSRTPVRDAVNRLAIEGLVEIQPRRGAFVASLNATDVSELLDLRRCIEVHAAEEAFARKVIPNLVSRLQVPMAKMGLATNDDEYLDYQKFIENDEAFHIAIVRAAGNSRLMRLYASLAVHVQIARAHHRSGVQGAQEAQEDHRRILSALDEGNPALVRTALSLHLQNVKRALLSAISSKGQDSPAGTRTIVAEPAPKT